MALRSTDGLSARPSLLRPQWGVRGSLFAAFAVIAGMAIVISAGAGMVLRHLGGTMLDLSGRDIPRLAASLQLAAQSASLASQGPALLAANKVGGGTESRASRNAEFTQAAGEQFPRVLSRDVPDVIRRGAQRAGEDQK